MTQEQYIQLQKLIEEVTNDSKTAKIIVFFEDGIAKKAELDIRVDFRLTNGK